MNFENPNVKFDAAKDVSFPSKDPKFFSRHQHSQFQSPLLQNPSSVTNNADTFSNSYNKPNSSSYNSYNNRPPFNGTIQNRVGWRQGTRRETNMDQKNNDRNSNMDNRNFNNRKRTRDLSNGAQVPRKQWRGKWQQTHQSNNNNQQNNSAQDRLNRIRNNSQQDAIKFNNQLVEPSPDSNEPEISNVDEPQDFDATDITVQVINHTVQPKEETNIRFKMVLDPQAQASIRSIQQKRKDKQVIFPFPVTPNVTGVSLHERFTQL